MREKEKVDLQNCFRFDVSFTFRILEAFFSLIRETEVRERKRKKKKRKKNKRKSKKKKEKSSETYSLLTIPPQLVFWAFWLPYLS